MKNIEQIKTLEKKETHEENKLQVKSFSELINLSEKRKEMEKLPFNKILTNILDKIRVSTIVRKEDILIEIFKRSGIC